MNRHRPGLAAYRAIANEHLVAGRIHVDIGLQVERVLLSAIGTLVKLVHGSQNPSATRTAMRPPDF